MTLYKYFRFNEHSISTLINNELWASSPKLFNDPFESMVTFKFEKNNQALFEEYVEKKAICCFSKNKENILMWSHYADSHRGFCVEIDDTIIKRSSLLSEVCYEELRVDSTKNFLSSQKKGEINKTWEKLLTHKHKDWRYEREVRLILNMSDRNSKGRIIDMQEMGMEIINIYFGCRMSQKSQNLIKKIMGTKANYYKMKPSETGFSLKPEPDP